MVEAMMVLKHMAPPKFKDPPLVVKRTSAGSILYQLETPRWNASPAQMWHMSKEPLGGKGKFGEKVWAAVLTPAGLGMGYLGLGPSRGGKIIYAGWEKDNVTWLVLALAVK